ncbi:hypothetical protein AAVH_26870 [Aphelenchoides avenae]|nr:hypothetical protein AAVH_26870 [Aphelenchus avenae]
MDHLDPSSALTSANGQKRDFKFQVVRCDDDQHYIDLPHSPKPSISRSPSDLTVFGAKEN